MLHSIFCFPFFLNQQTCVSSKISHCTHLLPINTHIILRSILKAIPWIGVFSGDWHVYWSSTYRRRCFCRTKSKELCLQGPVYTDFISIKNVDVYSFVTKIYKVYATHPMYNFLPIMLYSLYMPYKPGIFHILPWKFVKSHK